MYIFLILATSVSLRFLCLPMSSAETPVSALGTRVSDSPSLEKAVVE